MAALEAFSAGYYVGEFTVTAADGAVEHARMASEPHAAANAEIYADGEGIERLDAPLVAKLDAVHFPVLPAERVAESILELPPAVLAETAVEEPPALRAVLVATAERARTLLRWFTPYDLAGADEVA